MLCWLLYGKPYFKDYLLIWDAGAARVKWLSNKEDNKNKLSLGIYLVFYYCL